MATYGPATSDELGRWWGLTSGQAKKVFKALGDEVTSVEVEGWPAWALVSPLDELHTTTLPPVVRLLPYFDPYTIAVARHHQYLMPEEHKTWVYRAQGWISPVVLIDGRLAGVWGYDKQRSPMTVTTELFAPVQAEIQASIEAEARRLGDFWGDNIEIHWES